MKWVQPYSRSQCTAIAAQTQNGMRRTSATSTQLSKREAIEQPNAVNTDLRLAQLPALLSLGQLVEELLAHLMAERPRPLGGSLVRRTCLCLGSSSAKGSGLQKKRVRRRLKIVHGESHLPVHSSWCRCMEQKTYRRRFSADLICRCCPRDERLLGLGRERLRSAVSGIARGTLASSDA
jgi:hypothetical protein